ncbi:hypothetical protein OIU78_002799 [Salix suchowensis]|nr:hypothetical protein OIU78_002799 [Salix suchowensis]
MSMPLIPQQVDAITFPNSVHYLIPATLLSFIFFF